MTRRRSNNHSDETTGTQGTRHSAESFVRQSAGSYTSQSTAPTSLDDSLGLSSKNSVAPLPRFASGYQDEDLSPSTSLYPRSSVDTYSSEISYEERQDLDMEDCMEYSEIPPLPVYQHQPEFNVSPSSPESFQRVFPTMDRLTIRHDDFTSDGNMNLRVDVMVPGRYKRMLQLFHLRMYDLNKREFSLRRYCRDSGREVCNAKRKYADASGISRPHLQQSMSSAMKSLTGRPSLTRTSTAGSLLSSWSRPSTSHSSTEPDNENTGIAPSLDTIEKRKSPQVPTNAIKLEFSNYARVDIERRGNRNAKRYEFEWWGQKYAWRRVVDNLTGAVSYHLFRVGRSGHNTDNDDGGSDKTIDNRIPLAHIVPESRSPTQAADENREGGWIPPCHMWISDASLVKARVDHADVVIATGLMALVDDCIKERWQPKKIRRISLPLTTKTMDVEFMGPRAFMQHLLHRRYSDHRPHSPLRHQNSIRAH
ncbi:hypothetical protein F5Y15DRAFT_154382 [Xylariaceae sp. FL0016]|nr:hypothetical protein F5Y15DRAFT_154382 [Xylariaceae sp. FL0016]